MNDLKTLKDLGNPQGEFFDIETLKEEAVKWVKIFDEQLETDFGFEQKVGINRLYGGFDDCEVVGFSAKHFIIKFFNLSEEDLK